MYVIKCSLKEIEKSLNSKVEVFKREKSAAEILKADHETSIKELTKNLKVTKDKVKSMESELDKLKTEKQKINIRDLELNSYEVGSILINKLIICLNLVIF